MYPQKDLVIVAKLYYELKFTQKEIASKLNYSRPTISRMLDAAIKKGIVEIKVHSPSNSDDSLQKKLESKFNLEHVLIPKSYVNHEQIIQKDIGKAFSDYLEKIVCSSDIIGVSWGTTLNALIKDLNEKSVTDVKIVQLNGAVSKNAFQTNSNHIMEKLSKCYSAEYYTLPSPPIVDSSEIATAISKDSTTNSILEMGSKSDIAIFGIGRAHKDNILNQGGYFKKAAFDDLLDKGAVGDICSRYFNIQGEIVNEELDSRTIGISLDELKKKKHSIGIAFGIEKKLAVYGALKSGCISSLIIDEFLANEILNLQEERL